jgi:hypothetical protein
LICFGTLIDAKQLFKKERGFAERWNFEQGLFQKLNKKIRWAELYAFALLFRSQRALVPIGPFKFGCNDRQSFVKRKLKIHF